VRDAEISHLIGVQANPIMVECRLHQPTLAHVSIAFTGEQTVTQQGFSTLQATTLHGVATVLLHHINDDIGGVEEVEVLS